jgi:hypothetical protein
MRGWSFTIITIILLVLKDLLANFVITCTLKDRRMAWLCLKDRLGDQRGGGGEWEPMKILLEGD